ncbi:hypothetical protein EW145_g6699 [Phellinidium pouzarii]|uniref:glutathione peroxidase n=1 Tax=Phellinidium pouzarii TaxID=167371 RepID=A0A4V3XBP5_9AGAM|nr:hypothetical protein EW145_g6699 [Phellinidium pouzarii]
MLASIFHSLFPKPLSPEEMTEIKEFVDNAITSNHIVVFSKSYCPYCLKAKTLLKNEYGDVPAFVVELDTRKDGSAIQNYLEEMTGQRTVPSIFIHEKHIGGSDDLAALQTSGKLRDLINEAPDS